MNVADAVDASYVIGGALVLGPVILFSSLMIGLFGYSPEKARAIRNAEDHQIVLEEVRTIHIARPERFRHERLDRHPSYLSLHIAMWGYSWCVFAGQAVTSNVNALSPQTRTTMAISFLVGSSLVLFGSLMGARIGRWRVLRGIHDNITAPRLADDVRLPYALACAGLFSMMIGTGIYAWTSFQSTWGSVGGWITGTACIASAWLIGQFLSRIRRYSMARDLLINQAVSRLERRGGHVGD